MPEVTITADVLDRAPGPALSATSDMPVPSEHAQPAPEPDPTPPASEPPDDGEGTTPEPATEPSEGDQQPQDDTQPNAESSTPPSRLNRRFSDLTKARDIEAARREAAEAHAARLEKLLADALAPKPPPTPEPTPPPAPPPTPRPVRETFDTPEAYDEALIEWSTKRALETARAETEQHAKAEKEAAERAAAEKANADTLKAAQDAHAARRTAIIERLPDYAEVAERDDLKISLPMAMAILQSDDGPAAAYHLGKNPELAARIADMVLPGQFFPAGHALAGQPVPDAQRQLVEMGKVFVAAAAAYPQGGTKSALPPVPPPPPPINPVRRGTNAATTRTLEEIGNDGTTEEYAARRMPQLQAERRPGFFGGGTRPN
jgi:flagellum-specific peptidoglycan hydrolase FlgJ